MWASREACRDFCSLQTATVGLLVWLVVSVVPLYPSSVALLLAVLNFLLCFSHEAARK